MLKVYVAGPCVFRQDAKAYLEKVRALLGENGMEALIPLDNEVSGDDSYAVINSIYAGNVDMIDRADAVLANIAPFRGPHMDPGTAFEIGYAIAKGKPVYAYTPKAGEALIQRINWWKAHEDGPHLSTVGDAVVENFGETENLMIVVPSEVVVKTLEHAVDVIALDQAVKELSRGSY